MKDFDAMEDLETFKANHKGSNPLYDAVVDVWIILLTAASGFAAVCAFYWFCALLVGW